MTQLVVHTHEEGAGLRPAYAVCVVNGETLVRAVRPEWDAVAERLERALNASARSVPQQDGRQRGPQGVRR